MRSGGPGRLRWNWEEREGRRRGLGGGREGKGRRGGKREKEKKEIMKIVGNGDKYSCEPHLLGRVWLADLAMNCYKTRTQRMHMAAIVGQAETVVYAKTCSVNLQNQFIMLSILRTMLPILRIMLLCSRLLTMQT